MLRHIGIGQFGSLDLSVGRSVTLVPTDGGGGEEPPPAFERIAFVSTASGNNSTAEIENDLLPFETFQAAATALAFAYPAGPLEIRVQDATNNSDDSDLSAVQARLTIRGVGGPVAVAARLILSGPNAGINLTLDDVQVDRVTVTSLTGSSTATAGTIYGANTAEITTLNATGDGGAQGIDGSTDEQNGSTGDIGTDGEYPGNGTSGGDGSLASGGTGGTGSNGFAAASLTIQDVAVNSALFDGGPGGAGGYGGSASASGGNGGNGGNATGPSDANGGSGGSGGNGGSATGGDGGSGGTGGDGGVLTRSGTASVSMFSGSGGAGGAGGFGGSATANGGSGGYGGSGYGSGSPGDPGSEGSAGTAVPGNDGSPGSSGSAGYLS